MDRKDSIYLWLNKAWSCVSVSSQVYFNAAAIWNTMWWEKHGYLRLRKNRSYTCEEHAAPDEVSAEISEHSGKKKGVDNIPSNSPENASTNKKGASNCLWKGVFNFPQTSVLTANDDGDHLFTFRARQKLHDIGVQDKLISLPKMLTVLCNLEIDQKCSPFFSEWSENSFKKSAENGNIWPCSDKTSHTRLAGFYEHKHKKGSAYN